MNILTFEMQLASWNVNGIRACYKSGFLDWLNGHNFDVVGLQEVRAEESQVPSEILHHAGYQWHSVSAEKKGYSGVAILSKVPPLKIIKGLSVAEFDSEGRTICAEFQDFHFISAYFPNSQDGGKRLGFKIKYCQSVCEFAERLATTKPVVLCGDFNIAHQPIDLARPDENEETPGYLPDERRWMGQFLARGWVDTFRYQNPQAREAYSWWSARTRARERNIGWRIDYHAVSPGLRPNIQSASIQSHVTGSDHCPVLLTLKI